MSDSAKIARRLMEHLREADTIALYLADENEVDLRPLLPLLWETKRIAVPVCAAKGAMCMSELTEDAPLVKNRYGIEEPATLKLLPASAFDVIVVPIVAFDANGHRLGHGMGYYDRYLPRTDCPTMLLCRRLLVREEIPVEDHDLTMDYLVTEDGVVPCRP